MDPLGVCYRRLPWGDKTYDGFIENLIQVAIRRVKKPDFPDPYNRSCWVHSTLFDEI